MGAPGEATVPRHELYEHEADVGVRGIGHTRQQAFEQAALALTSVVTRPERVGHAVEVAITCRAPDLEILLADWLNAVIFEMSCGRRLFSRFEVSLRERAGAFELSARAWGEGVDRARHAPAVEVKGATLTTLRVEELQGVGWLAQTVLDV